MSQLSTCIYRDNSLPPNTEQDLLSPIFGSIQILNAASLHTFLCGPKEPVEVIELINFGIHCLEVFLAQIGVFQCPKVQDNLHPKPMYMNSAVDLRFV